MTTLLLLFGMNVAQAANVQFCAITNYGSIGACFVTLDMCQQYVSLGSDMYVACTAVQK